MRPLLLLATIVPLSLQAGSVIFLHPDGAGVAHWQAARMVTPGPDGELNWDRLPQVAIYRGHNLDNLTSTSNGGATIHAYGVKAPTAGFGSDGKSDAPLKSARGNSQSLLKDAKDAGLKTGVINSGSIIEPGTACFLASTKSRKDYEKITEQVLASGTDVILSGGEEWMLPKGKTGRHTSSGKRTDGKDLIAEARKAGYIVVFTAAELAKVPADTKKLLGVFAAGHTFHDKTEEHLEAAGLPHYLPEAPSLAQMTSKALELFGDSRFFLVIEEEGTDNFGNANNAPGTLEALQRADEAFGVALKFVENHPDTLLITAADSEAGGMDVIGLQAGSLEQAAVAANRRDVNGAPYDTDKKGPFLSAPDKAGTRHPFVITWASRNDTSGGIVIRAAGKNAGDIRGTMDNTDIYRVMAKVLFEEPQS